MTYIPGTGPAVPKEELPKNLVTKPTEPETITTVNVKELKNPEDKTYEEEDKIWYNQLKNWLIAGCGISLIFALFAFWNWRTLFLLPLGPYIGYVAWHARKWARKYSKKIDAFG